MTDLTLESLADRLAIVEKKLETLACVIPSARDWQSVVGISETNEFTRKMYEEIEAERSAARQGIEE